MRRPVAVARQDGASDQIFSRAAAQQGVKFSIHNQRQRIQIGGVAKIHQLQPGTQRVAPINQYGHCCFRAGAGPTEAALRSFLGRVELPRFRHVGSCVQDKALRQRRFSGLAHGDYVAGDAVKKPEKPGPSFPAGTASA